MSGEEVLDLPGAIVNRIIKTALPDTVLSKDARAALTKSASIFALYLTSAAQEIASGEGKKTIMPKHVITALQDLDFDDLVEPVEKFLEAQ